ncbi:MAG: TonB-dependent receptor [Sphingomonadales bacterium]|nr:TonB-dependent receptor [Sphingomonadales bacterium]
MQLKAILRAGTLLGAAAISMAPISALAQQQPVGEMPVANAPAQSATATTGPNTGFNDIVVTARRREESAQTVPVSITAFSGSMLEQRNVRELQDLNAITPGFRFSSEGGKNSNQLILRGLAKVSLGEGVPAVVTYFADVPLVGDGTNVPTYDLASIQVLKGPQGTLFGRNTLGGAVLIRPEAPSYEVGGYIRADYGRYDYRAIEGAINIPLIKNKAALRLAAQIRRQDGTIKNLDAGPDFNNIHQESFRASLLLEPVDGLTNLTIYDYFKAREQPGGLYLYQLHPGVIPGLSGLLDAQLAADAVQQQNGGFFSANSDLGNTGRANRKLWGVTNDTKFQVGAITFRNIFGYRESTNGQTINTGANGPLLFPVGPGVSVPFNLFTAASDAKRSYLSDEFQILGNLLDDRLNFIVGAFYNHDKPLAPGGSNFIAFSATGLPSYTTSHVDNRNTAIFGQIGYKITDRLTFNAGGRYSWDKVLGCGGAFTGLRYESFETCKAVAAQNLVDGVGLVRNKGSAPSWTFGFDYKANDDLFLYATTRRGYRGVNINTPFFETRFTSGGAGCATPTGICPDLRPFQKIGKETLTDGEIGFKWDWRADGIRGRLNVAAFLGKYKGALQFFNVVSSGIPQNAPDYPTRQSIGINAADETIKGVEVEAVVIPARGLTLSFNGAYTDTTIDRVQVPPIGGLTLTANDITKFTPKFSSTVAASWTLPVRPFGSEFVINGDYYHTSKFGAQVGRNFPGYDLFNARISLNDIGGSNLSLALAGRNLFNKKYFLSPSNILLSFPTNSAYVGEQRMWTLEAKYRF